MSSDLGILYKVQQADTELARLQQAIAALDTGAELEDEKAQLEAELVSLRGQLRASEKENLDCELEVKTLDEKRGRFGSQLYGGTVRNPRQLSDLHKGVEMLDREVRRLEDRSLELLEQMESQRGEIAVREARLREVTAQLEAARAKHASVSQRLRDEMAEVEATREGEAAQVGPHLLKRYEQIRARAGNRALVRVSGANCPACRIALPSETVKGLQAHRPGLTCENCGRLLFWDEAEE